MAPRISESVRERILAWRDEGRHPQEMADLAGCSLRTVYYLLSYDQDYGTTTNPFTRTFGRPRSLDIGGGSARG
jgi:DNA-binding CsgD family transcriptional regulator